MGISGLVVGLEYSLALSSRGTRCPFARAAGAASARASAVEMACDRETESSEPDHPFDFASGPPPCRCDGQRSFPCLPQVSLEILEAGGIPACGLQLDDELQGRIIPFQLAPKPACGKVPVDRALLASEEQEVERGEVSEIMPCVRRPVARVSVERQDCGLRLGGGNVQRSLESLLHASDVLESRLALPIGACEPDLDGRNDRGCGCGDGSEA